MRRRQARRLPTAHTTGLNIRDTGPWGVRERRRSRAGRECVIARPTARHPRPSKPPSPTLYQHRFGGRPTPGAQRCSGRGQNPNLRGKPHLAKHRRFQEGHPQGAPRLAGLTALSLAAPMWHDDPKRRGRERRFATFRRTDGASSKALWKRPSPTIPAQIWGQSDPGGTKVLWEGSKSSFKRQASSCET